METSGIDLEKVKEEAVKEHNEELATFIKELQEENDEDKLQGLYNALAQRWAGTGGEYSLGKLEKDYVLTHIDMVKQAKGLE